MIVEFNDGYPDTYLENSALTTQYGFRSLWELTIGDGPVDRYQQRGPIVSPISPGIGPTYSIFASAYQHAHRQMRMLKLPVSSSSKMLSKQFLHT